MSDLFDETPSSDVDADQNLAIAEVARQRIVAIDEALERIVAGT